MQRSLKITRFFSHHFRIESTDPTVLQKGEILQFIVGILYVGGLVRIGSTLVNHLGRWPAALAILWCVAQLVLFSGFTWAVYLLIRHQRINLAAHLFFLPLFVDEILTIVLRPETAVQHTYIIMLYLVGVSSVLSYRQSIYYIGFCYTAAFYATSVGWISIRFLIASFGMMLVAWVIANAQKGALKEASKNATQLASLNRFLQDRVNEQTADLRHQNVRLQFSLEVGRVASGSLNLEELLYNTAHLIRDEFGFYHVTVFLKNEHEEWLTLREATGAVGQEQKVEGYRIAVDSASVIGWVAQEKQSKLVEDVREDDLFQAHPLLPDTISELALPLVARGNLIGVLDVQTAESNSFSDEEITILQLMADQLANSIDNAMLFTALEQRTAALSELQVITNLMSQQSNTDNALNVLAHRTKDLLQTDGAGIFLWNKENEKLELALNLNIGDVPEGYQLNMGEGLAGQCFQQVQTMVVDDYAAWDGRVDPFTDINIRSIINVPLKEREQPIGVISLAHFQPEYRFSEAEIQTVELLAAQVGTIITNQQLIEKTRELVRRERLLNQASAQVRNSLDAETVLKAAAQQLGEILGNLPLKVRLYPPSEQSQQSAD